MHNQHGHFFRGTHVHIFGRCPRFYQNHNQAQAGKNQPADPANAAERLRESPTIWKAIEGSPVGREIRQSPDRQKNLSPLLYSMPAFDPTATGFSAANAVLLAELCKAAYLDEVPARESVLGLGLPGFIWIDPTEQFENVYAIAASGPGFSHPGFSRNQRLQQLDDRLAGDAGQLPLAETFRKWPRCRRHSCRFRPRRA